MVANTGLRMDISDKNTLLSYDEDEAIVTRVPSVISLRPDTTMSSSGTMPSSISTFPSKRTPGVTLLIGNDSLYNRHDNYRSFTH